MTVTFPDVVARVRYRYEHEDQVHITAHALPLSERDLTNEERLSLLQRAICDVHMYGDTLSWEALSYHVLSGVRARMLAEESDPAAGHEHPRRVA